MCDSASIGVRQVTIAALHTRKIKQWKVFLFILIFLICTMYILPSCSYSSYTFIRRHSPWFLFIPSSLVRLVEETMKKPLCGAETRIELGSSLQATKPTHYQLSYSENHHRCATSITKYRLHIVHLIAEVSVGEETETWRHGGFYSASGWRPLSTLKSSPLSL